MKMEFRKKTTATLMIAILMISVFAVSAYAEEGTHLISEGSIGSGNEDRIAIDMPTGFTLGDIDSISWWRYIVVGYAPHVDIILDLGGEETDALVIEYAYNDMSHYETEGPMPYGAVSGEWYQTFDDDGHGPSVITDTSFCWLSSGLSGPPTWIKGTLSEWKTGGIADGRGISASTPVLRLEFELDNWLVDSEAYVKDIQVNGQSGTVSMTVFVEESIVSISVDPTFIGFGSIVQGEPSDPQTVTITSASTMSIDLSASVDEDDSFYTDNLLLDNSDLPIWEDTIPEDGAPLPVPLILEVPGDATLGLHEGTLVFWAEQTS